VAIFTRTVNLRGIESGGGIHEPQQSTFRGNEQHGATPGAHEIVPAAQAATAEETFLGDERLGFGYPRADFPGAVPMIKIAVAHADNRLSVGTRLQQKRDRIDQFAWRIEFDEIVPLQPEHADAGHMPVELIVPDHEQVPGRLGSFPDLEGAIPPAQHPMRHGQVNRIAETGHRPNAAGRLQLLGHLADE